MDEELYEQIERYLNADMTEEERLNFEAQLKNESELQEKLAVYKSLTTTLSARFKSVERETQLHATLDAMKSTLVERKRSPFVWYATAASILLAAFLLYMLSSKPDYKDYAHFEPLALAERGSIDSIKLHAEQSFNAKQYEEAISYFQIILMKEPTNGEVALYKGIAYLEMNRFAEADALLDSLEHSSSIFKEKALWVHALSALKQEDYKTCRKLLEQIQPEQDDYEGAQKLLDKL